jgi:murein L,D-transpeptidase YafK
LLKTINNKKLILLFLAAPLVSIFFFSSASFGYTAKQISAILKLPEGENVIIVEKKTQTLLLICSEKNQAVVKLRIPCSTGERSGKKQISGDKKTPEGIYFIKKEYEAKELSPIYGKKAFPLDYPNMMDKKIGNGGSAIWMHGTNKALVPMNSNGCIVLENSHILQLKKYIKLDSTPVILTALIEKTDKETIAGQAQDISNMLDQFIASISSSSYHTYLSFFSDKYLPEISWWTKWMEIRKTFSDQDSVISLKRENTGIYYHNNIFVIVFDLFLYLDGEQVLLGKRKFFLEKEKYAYKIIGDTYQTIGKEFQAHKERPLLAGSSKIHKNNDTQFIRDIINQWLKTWSSKDMDSYATFYADNFYSDRMNKSQWIKRKTQIANSNRTIDIAVSDFKIVQKDDTIKVSFFQDYKSDTHSSKGRKILKLIKKGELWTIYQESWKRK